MSTAKRYMFTETTVYAITADDADQAEQLFEQWCEDDTSVPVKIIDRTLDREGFHDGYPLP